MEEDDYFKKAKQKVLEELAEPKFTKVIKERREISGEELKQTLHEIHEIAEKEKEKRPYKVTTYEHEDRSSFGFHLKGQIAHSMAIGGAILTVGSIVGHESLVVFYGLVLMYAGIPLYDAIQLARVLAYATPIITIAITIQGIRNAKNWWDTYLAQERLADEGLKYLKKLKKEREKA